MPWFVKSFFKCFFLISMELKENCIFSDGIYEWFEKNKKHTTNVYTDILLYEI